MLIAFHSQSTVNTDHLLEILPLKENGIFKLYFFFHDGEKESVWSFASEEERDRVYEQVKSQLHVISIS